MYYTWNQYFLLWESMETISPFSYFCMAVRNVCMCAWNKGWSGGEHVQPGFTVPQVGRQSPVACPHWAKLFQCSHMVNISRNTHKHTHLHSDTFMHTSTSHTDIHSVPVCRVSPKGDFIKDPWAQCYEEQQQRKKKKDVWEPLIQHTLKESPVGEHTKQQITSKFFVHAKPRKEKH